DQCSWLTGGGTAMGGGIWATHFIGMLSLKLPVLVTYDILMTGLSLVFAVLTATVALALVSRPKFSWPRLAAGGGVMGLAIAGMHYTSMGAMEMSAQLLYNWPLVFLSVTVAVVASTVALAFNRWSQRSNQGQAWVAGLATPALTTAIVGLHYTAMAATVLQPGDLSTNLAPSVPLPNLVVRQLALALGLGTAVILLTALVVVWVSRYMAEHHLQEAALANSEQRFRALIRDMAVGALLLNAEAEVLIYNQAAKRLLHLTEGSSDRVVFGQTGHLQHEDGTPFVAAELPVQQAIAQKAPLSNVVMGVSAAEAGSLRWLLVTADPQLNKDGQVERVVCTCSDITVQKRAEVAVRAVADREKAVTQIVQRMRQTLDLKTIFAATTEELQQALSCDRVWIYRFNPDWSGAVMAEALFDPTAPSTLDTATADGQLSNQDDCGVRELQHDSSDEGYLMVEDTYLQETKAEVYRQNRAYHRVNDIYTEGFDACYMSFLEQWQVCAYVIVPIFAGSQLWGLLGVYAHHQPRTWTRNEVK
ncbi:MAG: MHYT domain-containing protein, partial [Nodosilinea sp.]